MSDLDAEGTFVWTDGSNVVCTDWDNGQPNDDVASADEDCVRLKSGKWWDSSCTWEFVSVHL